MHEAEVSQGVGGTAGALATLNERGWASLRARADSTLWSKQELEDIAGTFGEVVPSSRWQLTASLTPLTVNCAKPTSLSGKFGFGEFPLHCDTAFWAVPCRYVLLACEEQGDGDVATVLLDTRMMRLSAAEKDLAERALFLIRNGRRSFYGSILSPHREFVRVDPGCFEPTDTEGYFALELFGRRRWEAHLHRISWTKGDIVLIDNWRVLHGREALTDARGERRLTRVLIR